MLVVPHSSACVLLDALLDGLGVYVHLYVSPVTLGPLTTLADLVEASWPGYAAVAVGPWTPSEWVGSSAVSWGDPILWRLTRPIVPEVVYGYYTTLGLAGPLAWAEPVLGAPIPLSAVGDQVQVVPQLTLVGV